MEEGRFFPHSFCLPAFSRMMTQLSDHILPVSLLSLRLASCLQTGLCIPLGHGHTYGWDTRVHTLQHTHACYI